MPLWQIKKCHNSACGPVYRSLFSDQTENPMIKETFCRSSASPQQPDTIRKAIILCTVLWFIASTGCYSAKKYRGSGRIVAVKVGNFWLHCMSYTVLLGPVDLNKKNKVVFALEGLPQEAMCLGFDTSLSDRSAKIVENRSDALIRVELVNEVGRALIRQEGRLDRWTWSYGAWEEYKSFVYLRGNERDRYFLDLRSDEASGSYFKPHTNGEYTLTVEVIEPDSKGLDYHAELKIDNVCP